MNIRDEILLLQQLKQKYDTPVVTAILEHEINSRKRTLTEKEQASLSIENDNDKVISGSSMQEMEYFDIVEELQQKIIAKYGSITNYCRHEDCAPFGGEGVKRYLYNTASNRNMKALVPIAAQFGIKIETEVIRTVRYFVQYTNDK